MAAKKPTPAKAGKNPTAPASAPAPAVTPSPAAAPAAPAAPVAAKASPPPPAPATALRPASVDEPTVDLHDPRSTTAVTEPPLACRFAPLAQDGQSQAARAHLKLIPGRDLKVHYERGASDVGAKGNVARIEMGYRFDDGVAAMSVVADGQRNLQGVLVRRAPAIRIPADARKELQLWFKLEMEDGSVFWDSAFSRNYRLAVLPQW